MNRLLTLWAFALALFCFTTFWGTAQAQSISRVSPDTVEYDNLDYRKFVDITFKDYHIYSWDSIQFVSFNLYYCHQWWQGFTFNPQHWSNSFGHYLINDSTIRTELYILAGMNSQTLDVAVHLTNGTVLRKDKAVHLKNINPSFAGGASSADFAVTPNLAAPGQTLDIVVSGGPGFTQATGTLHVDFGQGLWPVVTNYTEMVGNQILANITVPGNTKPGCYDALARYHPKDGNHYYDGRCQILNNAICVQGTRVAEPGRIRGRVFNDENRNCAPNLTEKGVKGIAIEALPGPYYAITDSNGYYTLDVPYGTYTLSQKHTGFWHPRCPAGDLTATVDSINVMADGFNWADTLLLQSDLGVFVNSGLPRPGFTTTGSLKVFNNASFAETADTYMIIDDTMHFVSSTPAPVAMRGDTLFYHWDAIPANSYEEVLFQYSIDPDPRLLRMVIHTSADVAGSSRPDVYAYNNHHAWWGAIGGSYDPNDKAVSPPVQFFEKDSVLSYRIRFQNTGTDTAFFVAVRDTLPQHLDIGSIKTMAASHRHVFSLKSGNVAEWRFANINLLDSNRNEPASHGYIDFTILRKKGLPMGTRIDNRAGIYFDFNPPVMTNYASTTLSSPVKVGEAVGTNGVTVYPNPLGSGQSILRINGKADLEGAEFQLLDVTGRRVAASAIRQGAAALERSRLKPGLYSFHITHKGKPASTGRLVLE